MGNAAKDYSDAGSSIVLGNRAIVAQSVTSNGIAIGTEAEVANTNGGVAIGNGAKATNTNGGDGSPVAVGQSAQATGTQAVAIGYNAIADNNQVGQTVVGSNASATANYGTIIGYGAKGTNTQANQTAIGYLATTNAAGGVALGANSNSDRPYDSISATSPYIPTGASDEQTKQINATKATTGAVSVGYTDSSDSSKNVRRQIINVAAGEEDTDAVNVAQLKAVQSQSASAGDLWTAQASGRDVKAANQRVNFVGKTDGHITVASTKDGEITFEATGLADTSLSNITDAGNTVINDIAAKAVKVSAEGTTPTDQNYVGGTDAKGNILANVTTNNGAKVYDLKLNKDVVLGEKEANKGGSITVNNVDQFRKSPESRETYDVGEAVKIDGKTVSIVKVGKADAETGENNEQRQVVLGIGQNTGGYIALNDSTGKKHTYIYNAISDGNTYLNSDTSKQFNRLEYSDYLPESVQFIATLGDGMKYAGDDGQNDDTKVITKKLNERLDIVGGAKGDLSDNNIGVTKDDNGKLSIRLAKKVDLDPEGSLKAGAATIGHFTNTELTTNKGKHPVDGSYTIGLGNKDWNVTDPEYVSGRAATEDQLKTISDTIKSNAETAAGQHTAVTVNDKDSETTAPVGTDGKYSSNYGSYSDPSKGNLLIAAKTKDGQTTYNIKLNDQLAIGKNGKPGQDGKDGTDGKFTVETSKGTTVVIGHDGEPGQDGKDGISVKGQDGKDGVTLSVTNGKDGKAGSEGHIGLTGPAGKDGKDASADIHVKNGQNGVDGTDGNNGKDGMDRIVYEDHNGKPHDVATMDDGLKFVGNDGQEVTRKLNETLSIKGGLSKTDVANASSKNLGVRKNGDGLEIVMTDTPDFTKVTVGGDNKITIGGQTNSDTKNPANGNYITSLDNTKWDKDHVTENRAATEGQLKDAINEISGKDKGGFGLTADDGKSVKKDLGQTVTVKGDTVYKEDGKTVVKDGNIKTSVDNGAIQISLNDQLAIGKNGKPGQDGKDGTDGKFTVETSKGTTVVIGHDGEPGQDGKDGISVKGQDGKDGVTLSVTNGKDGKAGSEGHIGLTGPAGKDGKDASADIHVKNGQNGVDGTDGNNGKDGMDRIVYEDHNGKPHDVATMDDGLKFVGNDGQEVTRKLNETLSIKGGLSKTDVANASSKNLGVRKNGDGLEIVMTDTPDFTKVTVGGNTKITIGEQTVTGKKADGSDADKPQTGNYITGLDNKAWDKDNIVENRAATEGQLRDVAGSITNQSQGGGFGLADEAGNTVKKDLGDTVTVKGDGKNIETKVNGGALEVSLNKDVDLTKDGSIKAGETTIDKDGVKTNEVKVGHITITKDGINGGAKQIINIASGITGNTYADAGDNNAASIGDVKQLAKNEAKASEAKSGKNITVKDDHTVNLNDDIKLGNDPKKQVAINGSNGQVVIGSGDSAMTLGKQSNTAGDSNPENGNYLNGLDNKKWDGKHIQSGRAATEDQLKTVSDKVNSGRVFQGDDGKEVKVSMGDTLKIQGGVKAEDVSQENNIGIVKGADDTLNIRLAKDLKGLDSVTTGNTTINNSGLTVKGDGNHKAITIQQGNVNMGGNKISGVADGKVSKDSTDAVNGSQLWQRDQAINGLSGSVNKLGNRINRVGAGAAALAALHPLDFDPDDKWDFAAGYGNYRGANAAAIGAYYRPNEDTMFSVGGSFGGGENMVNAGVSIKLGQGNHVSTSRVAMAKEMKAMRQHMAEQDALIAKLQSMHGMAVDPTKSTLFPDVAENHWAYQYVTTLAKNGILEGYPDGKFKGDRMMTRYEFAAIVYRIVESGVGSTDPELSKLVKEFSPELQYIRIDTIQKDRNGKPTIERVRVISDAK